MAYWKVMCLWIWVLQPWPQFHKCQGSWSVFSRQRATRKLILLWLFPWQWHSPWKHCAPAWAMLAHPAVAGSPLSRLVTLEETWEKCCLSPDTLADYLHQVEFSAANTPPTCLLHPSGSTAGDAVAASSAKVLPSATSLYTWFCEAAFREELFGQNNLQMNKNKTAFIKEILETATSEQFLVCSYILARKHVLVKESTLQLKTLRQHNGTTQKAAGTAISVK